MSLSNRKVVSAALATVLLLVAGCGSGDIEPGGHGSTVAEAELGGDYLLTRLVVGGNNGGEVSPDDYAPTVNIETDFGALRIETECGDLLGSFSLLADGRAGFTVAGGSTRLCDAASSANNELLVSALGRVDSWSGVGADSELDSGSGLHLESRAGDLIELTR